MQLRRRAFAVVENPINVLRTLTASLNNLLLLGCGFDSRPPHFHSDWGVLSGRPRITRTSAKRWRTGNRKPGETGNGSVAELADAFQLWDGSQRLTGSF